MRKRRSTSPLYKSQPSAHTVTQIVWAPYLLLAAVRKETIFTTPEDLQIGGIMIVVGNWLYRSAGNAAVNVIHLISTTSIDNFNVASHTG